MIFWQKFGDISREIENRRREWVKGFLGAEAAENYEFGSITKKALTNFTGKDDYEFGDVSKKILGDIFGKRKRGGKWLLVLRSCKIVYTPGLDPSISKDPELDLIFKSQQPHHPINQSGIYRIRLFQPYAWIG